MLFIWFVMKDWAKNKSFRSKRQKKNPTNENDIAKIYTMQI
jgi:hypothetical protein